MSRENVDLVRRLLEMFKRREHERVFELYDPDIEYPDQEEAIEAVGLHG